MDVCGSFYEPSLGVKPDFREHQRLARTSAVIGDQDVKDLRWYLAGGANDAYSPQASTFGALLERASLLNLGSRPCRNCGGKRRPEKAGTGFVPRDGTRYVVALKNFRRSEAKRLNVSLTATPRQAAALKLVGIDAYPKKLWNEFYTELPHLLCRMCTTCNGRGWVEHHRKDRKRQVTARPTGSSKHGGTTFTVETDEEALTRSGKVSRKLRQVREIDPVAAAAIARYYGPEGGGLGSLWHLTAAGKTLLRRNHLGLSVDHFFSNERAAEQAKAKNLEKGDSRRRKLFESATEQASELFEAACRLWNEVTSK